MNKVLPIFFSPIMLTLLAVLFGLILRKKWLVAAGFLVLLVASTPMVANRLFDLAQGKPVLQPPESMPIADAVVVLAGAGTPTESIGGFRYEWSDAVDRILAGVALMDAARAERLVLSRGMPPPRTGGLSEGEAARDLCLRLGVPLDKIVISDFVRNTEQESFEIRSILPGQSPKIILVTSAFHMDRAASLFEKRGFRVQRYPVDLRLPLSDDLPMSILPSPNALNKTDIVIREWLGRRFYWLRDFLGSDTEVVP